MQIWCSFLPSRDVSWILGGFSLCSPSNGRIPFTVQLSPPSLAAVTSSIDLPGDPLVFGTWTTRSLRTLTGISRDLPTAPLNASTVLATHGMLCAATVSSAPLISNGTDMVKLWSMEPFCCVSEVIRPRNQGGPLSSICLYGAGLAVLGNDNGSLKYGLEVWA